MLKKSQCFLNLPEKIINILKLSALCPRAGEVRLGI